MPASPCKLRLHLVYHYVLSTAKVWIFTEETNFMAKNFVEIVSNL